MKTKAYGAAWVTSDPSDGTRRADAGTVPTGGGVLRETGTLAGYCAIGNAPFTLVSVVVDAVPIEPHPAAAPVVTESS
jgi:hypothetical protein